MNLTVLDLCRCDNCEKQMPAQQQQQQQYFSFFFFGAFCSSAGRSDPLWQPKASLAHYLQQYGMSSSELKWLVVVRAA